MHGVHNVIVAHDSLREVDIDSPAHSRRSACIAPCRESRPRADSRMVGLPSALRQRRQTAPGWPGSLARGLTETRGPRAGGAAAEWPAFFCPGGTCDHHGIVWRKPAVAGCTQGRNARPLPPARNLRTGGMISDRGFLSDDDPAIQTAPAGPGGAGNPRRFACTITGWFCWLARHGLTRPPRCRLKTSTTSQADHAGEVSTRLGEIAWVFHGGLGIGSTFRMRQPDRRSGP